MKTVTVRFTWPGGSAAVGTRREKSADDVTPTAWVGDAARIASLPAFVRDSEAFPFRGGRGEEARAFAQASGATLDISEAGDWEISPDDVVEPPAVSGEADA